MAESWSSEENELVVRGYFDILDQEMSGTPIMKSTVYRKIAEHIGRTPKAVEYKMLNVSGVLRSLGLGHAAGLRPYGNYQQSLRDVVEEHLVEEPSIRGYLEMAEREPSDVLVRIDVNDGGSRVRGTGQRMRVEDLWAFAVGGQEVAVAPGRTGLAPTGPRPAAVEEASEWMQEAMQPGFDGPNRFLFLVGGPGGGKSDVASRLVDGLVTLDSSDGLAHRVYRYSAGTRDLLLVNDATIPADSGGDVQTLADDVNAGLTGHVIACVNRGVLVDEAPREPNETLGRLLAEWLRDGTPPPRGGWRLEEQGPTGLEYLKQATVLGPAGEIVEAVAVFVDVCSLLEQRPTVQKQGEHFTGNRYEIAIFEPARDRGETPAGILLSEVAQTLAWESKGSWDPIAANLQSLSSATIRRGVLSVLRAAELATSQRFAYRQIWGIIARLVAGPWPEQVNKDELLQWYERMRPEEKDPRRSFEDYQRLAAARSHEALFGGAWSPTSRHPVLSATSVVDPSRDMPLGSPTSFDDGWSTPISEAFAAAQLGASPLSGMMEEASSEALNSYITDFDRELDRAFVAALGTSQDSDWIARTTAWYGRYLSRMLAVAHGYPAYARQLRYWTRAWMVGAVEDDLGRGLETLVRPPRFADEVQGVSQVPLFASRAEAVLGTPERPKLVSTIGKLGFTTTARGEDLMLQIRHDNKTIGEVRLDLDLVREALASSEGWLGLTDATESVIPRLERFRSINLIAQNRDTASLNIIGPEGDHRVTTYPLPSPKEVHDGQPVIDSPAPSAAVRSSL